MRAPEFHGLSDSLAAHKWKEDVGNILEILNVTLVQKQTLSSYSLKGDTGRWYRLQFTPEQRMTLTWEDFVYVFDEQYISFATRAGKELELSRLTQGDMSVADFESRFMSLLHFTGLRPSLRRYLISRRFYSIREVADAATSQENKSAMFQKDKEGNIKDKDKNKRPFSGPQQQQQGPHKRGPQHDQRAPQHRKFHGTCFKCHKIGHRASNCRSAPAGAQQGKW
ncbi:uncharacterized protein LOC109828054 [Asparagus officinalis]|uniref:uncharacterized protein LOC109828054 n=1 Tax=Asparagus officinalis TaxID=4686 RepID=UPI00098E21B2|nr:uncharacterized protein LOC109828054 [Asparagus officinalis]